MLKQQHGTSWDQVGNLKENLKEPNSDGRPRSDLGAMASNLGIAVCCDFYLYIYISDIVQTHHGLNKSPALAINLPPQQRPQPHYGGRRQTRRPFPVVDYGCGQSVATLLCSMGRKYL